MSTVRVEDYKSPVGWTIAQHEAGERARDYCEQLERGQILFFENTPFDLPEDDLRFLLSHRRTDSRFHKNISYRPQQDALRGYRAGRNETAQMHEVMRHYSQRVNEFLGQFLAPYAAHWQLDFASFRPLEESTRELPLHKRNDLLHVDAFPTRPTKGARILRVFSNINQSAPRVWLTTDKFEALAERFATDAGLQIIAAQTASSTQPLMRQARRLMNLIKLPVIERSAYDQFMLRFHDYLKENTEFQQKCPKIRLEFPPRATWIVFTDAVPHAVLAGQFALEQTYIIPTRAMIAPQRAPIHVLESLCGHSLSN